MDRFSLDNPWWLGSVSERDDPHLCAIEGRPYYYRHQSLLKLPLEAGEIHVLRGPRQVGKTTLLKEWIRRLLVQEKVRGQRIFFLSCETLESFGELAAILKDWFSNHKQERTYVFLDEVSFVPDWQRAILSCSNSGLLQQTTLMITGSNARDLKMSSERLPGRRGTGKDLRLFPLSPRQYLELECFKGKSHEELMSIFLRVGGFPHALRDFVTLGRVSEETYATYRNWIIGDALRYGLTEENLKHILFRVVETLTSRITFTSLIEGTPIRSHETALSYLEHIQDAFLAHLLYCYDPNKKGPAYQKARKVYFIDPLLYFLVDGWKNNVANVWGLAQQELQSPQFEGNLLEAIWVSEFARSNEGTYFWYSAKQKREVDLVLLKEGKAAYFDVKRSAAGTLGQANGHAVQALGAGDLFREPG